MKRKRGDERVKAARGDGGSAYTRPGYGPAKAKRRRAGKAAKLARRAHR